jgi:NAD(P)-dependent dehydrogenase (short-subunit alcohol dehydrogenase family)
MTQAGAVRRAAGRPHVRGRRRDRLAGRVVLVTGASAGIGAATVDRLEGSGATVVASARDEHALARRAVSPAVLVEPADLSRAEERSSLVERVLVRTGRLDGLVAVAGIGMTAALTDMTADQVAKLVDTNVTATIDLVRLALPYLELQGGAVVLVASAASWCATPPLTVYCATKYAVAGFAEGLRREVSARGVRVHSVHPGFVATQFAARSAGPDPGERHGAVRPGPGIPPALVARAVEGCLLHPRRRCVAVPRALGATRVVKLPGLSHVVDLAASARADQLLRLGRRLAEGAADPADH